jgi:3-dehydroquinate synthase
MRKVEVALAERSYEIWIGDGLYAPAAHELKREGASKAFVFADRKVLRHARELIAALRDAGWQTTLIELDASEGLKDFGRIFPLYGKLLKAGADRGSVIFAVGGGVIGDAVGFLAGTFLRGVRWVGVPTTLLAQVDSSIGGKIGINHPMGKNLIGAFHQPSLVLCERATLSTLPKRELVSGLGEMVKYALIGDRGFFRLISENWPALLGRKGTGRLLVDAIAECAVRKARVVEKDELDRKGIRDALNFGHTVGHALESITGYERYRHGEAIVLGMRVAVRLSVMKGHLASETGAEMDRLLAALPVPSYPRGLKPAKLLPFVRRDKKKTAGRVRFVLLKDFGRVTLDSSVTEEEILEAIEVIRK